VAGEGVGGIFGDQYAEVGHSRRVEYPAATPPVPDGDHGALAAAVDAASFHRAPLLLAIRQLMWALWLWR
jgi:hypothetical protein